MVDHSLEAKICVLGAQGVGKTSLVQRYVNGAFTSPLSTIGASFLTKKTTDEETGTAVRLQIWDTAGQERYRSLSQLYYRGASAVILVYSIIDEASFREMGRWLEEVRDNLGDEVVIHVVGTKGDVVAENQNHRAVPFDRCIAYVAEKLHPTLAVTPMATAALTPGTPAAAVNAISLSLSGSGGGGAGGAVTPGSWDSASFKRHSGFWMQDAGWDDCHEISASTGEGIDEVFRVVTRKLVEKRQKKLDDKSNMASALSPGQPLESGAGVAGGGRGYFDRPRMRGDAPYSGSGAVSRPGTSDKRRSWLGFPSSLSSTVDDNGLVDIADLQPGRRSRCC